MRAGPMRRPDRDRRYAANRQIFRSRRIGLRFGLFPVPDPVPRPGGRRQKILAGIGVSGAGANADHLKGIARTDESDRLSPSVVVRLIVNVLVLLIVLEMAQNLSGFLTRCPNFAFI
jgi:hypothetical protein